MWIFDHPFNRLTLDEAHIIRNSSTGRFAATMAINAVHKLAITGTPYINKASLSSRIRSFTSMQSFLTYYCFTQPYDLYSLFNFSRRCTLVGKIRV